MNKLNFAFPSLEALEQIERATIAQDAVEPRIQAARFDEATRSLVLTMRGGVVLTVPVRLLGAFEEVPPLAIHAIRIVSGGSALHWDMLDVQMTTMAIIRLGLGVKSISENARKAGSTQTAAKSAAARENGRKGGRPRKVPVN